MTTSTTTFQRGGGRSRSSGPQQHDGVVLQVELQEVEAPHKDPQIQSAGGGRLGFEEEGGNLGSLGAGVLGQGVLRPKPPLSLYREVGVRPRHPLGP